MRDLYQEITNRMIAKLETGTLPWVKGWNSGAGIPQNAVSNRPYSGINVLLFWLSADKGYRAPRYVTYKQAQEAGGNVRKGEHGELVVFFKKLEVKDPDALPGEVSSKDREIAFMRGYTVFNVDQCDGLPDKLRYGPSGPDKVNPDTREQLADDFIRATGADFREGAGKPCYVPSKDFITVPAWSDFHSLPEYYAAAFHELVHWTGHKDRLDRDLKGRFDKHAYAAEELIAELGAAYLCAEFGFDNAHDNQAAYLAHWLELLKSDKRAIFTAASKAQKAADYMRGLALAEPAPLAIAA
jgi:antirestriction protein ArdC